MAAPLRDKVLAGPCAPVFVCNGIDNPIPVTGDLEVTLVGSVTPFILCDDNGSFVRIYMIGEMENVIYIETELDGTPYAAVGDVVVCSQTVDLEMCKLCDDEDDTLFLRFYVSNESGTIDNVFDRELDGMTDYVVVGNPVPCPIVITGIGNLFNPANLVPNGAFPDENLAVSNVVIPFATVFDILTTHVVWSVEPGGPISITFDSSNPTAVNGHTLYPRDRGIWTVETAQAAKMIRVVGFNGSIHISQMKPRI